MLCNINLRSGKLCIINASGAIVVFVVMTNEDLILEDAHETQLRVSSLSVSVEVISALICVQVFAQSSHLSSLCKQRNGY